MYIQTFTNTPLHGVSVTIKLPRRNLKLDPRASVPNFISFDCRYHDDGITVTLTRIDKEDFQHIVGEPFWMRVYDTSIETVPDFESTTYIYMGQEWEKAPYDTIVGIIHPSVKIIGDFAFQECTEMKKCIMHNAVETIDCFAFSKCFSLDALFLPSSLKKVETQAFYGCNYVRILPLPLNIDIRQLIDECFLRCDTLFRVTQIQRYEDNYGRGPIPGLEYWHANNKDEVHQALLDFYRNLPPLHRACLDTNVTRQTIHDCIRTHGTAAASIIDHDGMTPLHVLAINPHADEWAILECFEANMIAAFMEDSRGNTPLDYLLEYGYVESYVGLVRALCMHRYGMMGLPFHTTDIYCIDYCTTCTTI